MAINLTEDDIQYGRYIYRYGGYTTIKNFMLAFPDIGYENARKRLNRLVQHGLVTVFKLEGQSKRFPNIYKATHALCTLCGNKGSYAGKNHKEEYAKRKLIENEFLSFFQNEFDPFLLVDVHDKSDYLIALGYNSDLFPRILNGSNIYIEEKLFARSNKDHPLIDFKNDVVFIYTDDTYKSIASQLKKILKRYTEIFTHNKVKSVEYIIVTESEIRKNMYLAEINKALLNDDSIQDSDSENITISSPKNEYVNLYCQFLNTYQKDRYAFLQNKLRMSQMSKEQIITTVSKHLTISVPRNKQNKSTLRFVLSLNYEEFVAEIKGLLKKYMDSNSTQHIDEIDDLFSAAFALQIMPKVYSNMAKSEFESTSVRLFNFNVFCINDLDFLRS